MRTPDLALTRCNLDQDLLADLVRAVIHLQVVYPLTRDFDTADSHVLHIANIGPLPDLK